MDDRTILGQTTECVDLFKGFHDVFNPDQHTDGLQIRFVAEEQASRLRIWAGTFGVFAKDHGSLDHRLRRNEYIKQAIVNQLSECQGYLQHMIRLPAHAELEDVAYTASNMDLGTIQSATTSSTMPDIEVSTHQSEAYLSSNPVLAQELRGMEETIDRLYRMSSIIRAPPSAVQRWEEAERTVLRGDDGSDISQEFKSYASRIIQHRFPDISAELLNRLSQAVLVRRKGFELSKRHQDKLDVLDLVQSSEQTRQAAPMVLPRTSHRRAQAAGTNAGQPWLMNRDKELLSTTTVSQMPTVSRRFFDMDSKAPASTMVIQPHPWKATLGIPLPPKIPSLAKEFQCPYCFTMLSSNEAMAQKWTEHVLKDVAPYVCVFDDCHSESVVFASKQLWISHLGDHKSVWVCNYKSHDPLQFRTPQDYEGHIEAEHLEEADAPSRAQIPYLTSIAERRAQKPLEICPFCQLDFSSTTPETSFEHVQHHLSHVALLSLPWRDDMNVDGDTSSRKTISSQNRSISDDMRSLSSEFYDIGSSSRPGDDQELILSGRPPSNDVADVNEEWGFVKLPDEYDDYSGHELDPILQQFMKEVYLGITRSPSESLLSRRISLPCLFLPPVSDRGCFGREAVISEMARGLCPSLTLGPQPLSRTDKLRSFALCGPGGMGKTSVAREFVQRYRDHFDAVLWVHGDAQNKLLRDFRQIAIELGLVDSDSVDSRDQLLTRDLVKQFLINPRRPSRRDAKPTHEDVSWLLIFDGADDYRLLKDFWPYGGPGNILITSRDHLAFPKVHKLGPLDDSEAVRLLLHLTGRDRTSRDKHLAAAIVKRVGGFPITLTHTASFINTRQWSLTAFLEAYEAREATEARNVLRKTYDGYKSSLASTWGFENLKYGHVLLDILSMLDPDGVHESLLVSHIGHARLDSYPDSINNFKRAKIELLQSSLISEDRGLNSISLHRLVSDVAQNQMSTKRYCSVFLECTRIVSAEWPHETLTWRHGNERWAKCEKLFPHVLRLLEVAKPVEVDKDEFDGHYEFARLLTAASWYHHQRGGSDESVEYSTRAENILNTLLEHVVGSDLDEDQSLIKRIKSTLAEIHHNKGCFASETNNPKEALIHHTEFNRLMVSEYPDSFPQDDMRIAISWNELGVGFMLNDDWATAEQCFEKSLAAIKALDIFDPLQLSLPTVNLGLTYWLQGRITEAAEMLLSGLEERESAFGKDDQDSFVTGRFLHALGNVKTSQGCMNDSLDYHRRALLQYKSTLGNNHHRTADLHVRLAFHHIRLRQYDLSLALLDQALKIFGDRAIFSRERLRVRYNKSKIFHKQGKYKDAELEMGWCLQRYREISGQEVQGLQDDQIDQLIVFWSR